jgi:hypothetical protein
MSGLEKAGEGEWEGRLESDYSRIKASTSFHP